MSVEPVPQELASESQSPDQQALDAIARLHAEKQELERDVYPPLPAGPTEIQALSTVAISSFLWGWMGTALAGGAFGTLIFPIVGTFVGCAFALLGGIVPCLLAALLYAMSRGHVPPKFAMGGAGAAAGVGCVAGMSPYEPLWQFAALAGLCGAVGARWTTRHGLRRYWLKEGLGTRSARRFSIFDLMLLTGWTAIFLTLVRIGVLSVQMPWSRALIILAISLACAGVIEGFAQLFGAMRTNQK
ncbi:hypothetical protein [Aeoliella sp.]|uniref:hypothetical protein n=1 Tax=Aeoliella sp. TaxID=2795800 RepID=UPI003CCC3BAB